MRDEIKQTAEAIANHPKTSIVITSVFTSNVWLDYGEPLVKGLTSLIGLAVLFLLAVKHFLDIKKEHFNDK